MSALGPNRRIDEVLQRIGFGFLAREGPDAKEQHEVVGYPTTGSGIIAARYCSGSQGQHWLNFCLMPLATGGTSAKADLRPLATIRRQCKVYLPFRG